MYTTKQTNKQTNCYVKTVIQLLQAEGRQYASVKLPINSDNGLSPGRRQAII